jgi:hypothetical protein
MGKQKISLPDNVLDALIHWRNKEGKTLSQLSNKLEEVYGYKVSRETLRLMLIECGITTSKPSKPKETQYQTGYEFNGEEADFNYNVEDAEVDEFANCGDGDIISKVLIKFGFDPEEFELEGNLRVARWQSAGSDKFLSSYRFHVRKKKTAEELIIAEEEINLPTLFAEASKNLMDRIPIATAPKKRALMVPWADPQTGKQDKLGGTQALIERSQEKREKLLEYIKDAGTTSAYFLDAGDGIEGFENTTGQPFTNTLSLMDQIDLEATLEQKMIELLAATHDEVIVSGIDSNHCKWRAGKGVLGLPKDDWGRFIKRQLKKAFELNPEKFGHISFDEPDQWERTINLDVLGTGVGLAHGDQVNTPDAIPKCWAGQTHGATPIALSEILITGHFHHFLMRPSGRHINTQRQKWHLQMPAMDNGSSWYAHQSGESSDPGLVVFTIDEDTGFNLQSLTIL